MPGLNTFSENSIVDERLMSQRFPRSAKYHPDWLISCASGGANSLWLTEWLMEGMALKAGMRVLDLGCGLAASSIFMRREFGVEVWATDLWFSAENNARRIREAGIEEGITAVHADARSLPFEPSFFDAIVSIDSFPYYGTDDFYLAYVGRLLKPGGLLGIASAGMMRELEDEVPAHLARWWTNDLWCLHSAPWWRRHWQKTGIVDVLVADTMEDGWRRWLDWHHVVAPNNVLEIEALEADRGRYLGYVRVIGRRTNLALDEPVTSVPMSYETKPLLRSHAVTLLTHVSR